MRRLVFPQSKPAENALPETFSKSRRPRCANGRRLFCAFERMDSVPYSCETKDLACEREVGRLQSRKRYAIIRPSGKRKACAASPTERRRVMRIKGIDEKDNQIVNLLREDGRMSYSDIGERVGLSRTAVKARMTALREGGIIKGYRAVIDPLAAPEMMTFVTEIETRPESFEECKQLFSNSEETVTLVQTTGGCRLVAICVAADVGTMRDFVNRVYKAAPGILSIHAHSVLDVIKGSILPEQ